jgi:type I restriction enzyme M protein
MDRSSLGSKPLFRPRRTSCVGNLDAAEYKHGVLGLIFLKYISDAFEEKHAALQKEEGADLEDRDEYLAENIFSVPPDGRWSFLRGRAKQPTIGKNLGRCRASCG